MTFPLRQSAHRSSLHHWHAKQSRQGCFFGEKGAASGTYTRPGIPRIRT